ncbi:MAG TPA: (2Fe-2S)-binding protein [Spirochaetota bacterium]|nr:(2Fe-2S)-binding protein [Spirochaetota bacterium]
MEIRFVLNRKEVTIDTDPLRRLLDVLREDFGLTGVKEGCGEGECGACSVLIDGELALSCITPVGTVQGASVVTIEGLRETKRYGKISDAFAEAGSVQCGFCTPGFVIAAEALLRTNSSPTEDEIREAISGNFCRCTGYSSIVEGIRIASRRGREKGSQA